MDFSPSPTAVRLIDEVNDFMDAHVRPAEPVYLQQLPWTLSLAKSDEETAPFYACFERKFGQTMEK